MMNVIKVIKEISSNIVVIHRLALHDLLTKHKGNLLGILWVWINPTIQIAIYAFIYGYGIRQSKPVNSEPFFYWLIAGFIMWMYINGVVNTGSRSIVSKMGLITKMRFPVSITPAVTVLAELYIHILMIITVALVFIFVGGYSITKYWLYLPYFTISATCFLYSISLFNSAITTMFRDYQHLVYNTMRTMFFVTPIIFPMENMAPILKKIVKLNPFTYLIEGYRESILFSSRSVFMSYRWGAYFWGVTTLFFVFGAILHVKMRKNILDYK